MHPNPAFRQEPEVLHLNLVRTRGFGTLVVQADPVPHISHVPFVLAEDGRSVDLHLARSNPIARGMSGPTAAVIAVSGPDGYVSPDWYEDPQHGQVPTWNYVAVHLTGTLEALPAETLRAHLDMLSESFETRLAPKRPWTTDKMPEGAVEKLMRAIVPFRFTVDRVDGTWKLGQNKPGEMRRSAAQQMKHSPIGHETDVMAMLMIGGGTTGLEI
ncbi:FMN-binding negative transcriptional regulator [Rhodobacterales bacterium HKCCE2091]|nr:FMN-binding negative transcriptional regulator [Rhodobacterales bacterium HKCCE2091]